MVIGSFFWIQGILESILPVFFDFRVVIVCIFPVLLSLFRQRLFFQFAELYLVDGYLVIGQPLEQLLRFVCVLFTVEPLF